MISEDRQRALDQILEITVLLGADMAATLGEQGLTETRAHALFHLLGAGPSTQRVLADVLEVSPRTVTTLVDDLEAAGLVRREAHPTDRRATLVTLTATGAETAQGFVSGRVELADQLFDGLDDDRLAGLVAGLEHTLGRLRTLVDPS